LIFFGGAGFAEYFAFLLLKIMIITTKKFFLKKQAPLQRGEGKRVRAGAFFNPIQIILTY